jgi:hypothetical protein
VDRLRLQARLGKLAGPSMERLDEAIKISLGLTRLWIGQPPAGQRSLRV